MYAAPNAQPAFCIHSARHEDEPLSRIAKEWLESFFRLGRGSLRSAAGSPRTQADTSLAQFQDALQSAPSRYALRERLARRSGAEALEFLVAVRSFDEATNPLQRYQLLSGIVHRFVRSGAERSIPLTDMSRRAVMTEWSSWDERGRIPRQLRFRALEAATIEVNALVTSGAAAAH